MSEIYQFSSQRILVHFSNLDFYLNKVVWSNLRLHFDESILFPFVLKWGVSCGDVPMVIV